MYNFGDMVSVITHVHRKETDGIVFLLASPKKWIFFWPDAFNVDPLISVHAVNCTRKLVTVAEWWNGRESVWHAIHSSDARWLAGRQRAEWKCRPRVCSMLPSRMMFYLSFLSCAVANPDTSFIVTVIHSSPGAKSTIIVICFFFSYLTSRINTH